MLTTVIDVSAHMDAEGKLDWKAPDGDWTEGFQKEFQTRRGYDLLPRLLCVSGRVLDNTETTERVLWDLRTTVSELIQENYFGCFSEKCDWVVF